MTLDADFTFGEEINKLKKWNKIDSVHPNYREPNSFRLKMGLSAGSLMGPAK